MRWILAYVPLITSILPRNYKCPASFLPRIIVIPFTRQLILNPYPKHPFLLLKMAW